jgi:membrane-bound inhibitor of C-type lysozyme
MSKALSGTVAAAVIAVAAVALLRWSSPPRGSDADARQPIATASYACDAGRVIDARFYEGPTVTAASGEPPVPGGSAVVSFDHGRELELHRTLSADGARYALPDESVVFWSKGDGAIVMKGETLEPSWANCRTTSGTR